jgi:hypothetical protein
LNSVREIQTEIEKLSPAELGQLREWFENYVEDQLELTDNIKAQLHRSHCEIAKGTFTTRQPQ